MGLLIACGKTSFQHDYGAFLTIKTYLIGFCFEFLIGPNKEEKTRVKADHRL
jgi:hypothetical protein